MAVHYVMRTNVCREKLLIKQAATNRKKERKNKGNAVEKENRFPPPENSKQMSHVRFDERIARASFD